MLLSLVLICPCMLEQVCVVCYLNNFEMWKDVALEQRGLYK